MDVLPLITLLALAPMTVPPAPTENVERFRFEEVGAAVVGFGLVVTGVALAMDLAGQDRRSADGFDPAERSAAADSLAAGAFAFYVIGGGALVVGSSVAGAGFFVE